MSRGLDISVNIHIYIPPPPMPTSMFTLTSWFSFILPPTSYPARTSLLVTIFLCQVLLSFIRVFFPVCFLYLCILVSLYPEIITSLSSRHNLPLSGAPLSNYFQYAGILPCILVYPCILTCPGFIVSLPACISQHAYIVVHFFQIGIFNAVIKDTPNENGG